MAAEYILKEGNPNVMLCERGIRTFESAYRATLDLQAVPVLKELSHLPVVVDPSHAAGRRELVRAMSLAAAAAGADGIIVEVHPNPDEAVCDGPQALATEAFAEYAAAVHRRRRSRARRPIQRRSEPLGRRRLMNIAILGVGLIGGSIGHRRARARSGARARLRRDAEVLERALEMGAIDEAAGDLASAVRRRRGGLRRHAVGALANTTHAALAHARRSAASSPTSAPLSASSRRAPPTSASSAATRWRAPRARAWGRRAPDMFDGRDLVPDSRLRGTSGVLYERLTACSWHSARSRPPSTRGPRPRDGGASRTCRTCSRTCSWAQAAVDGRAADEDGARGLRRAVRPGRAFATPRASRAPTARSGPTSTWPTVAADRSVSTPRSRRLSRGPRAARGRRRRGAARVERAGTRREGPPRPRGGRRRRTARELRVVVPNRPGVIAEIALALGRAGVNIVDMALSPSEDNRQGVVALWVRWRGAAGASAGAHRRARLPRGAHVKRALRALAGAARRAARAARQVDLPPRGARRRDGLRTGARRQLPEGAADTRATREAARALGALVEVHLSGIVVRGTGLREAREPAAPIDVGERRHADAAAAGMARGPAGPDLHARRRRLDPAAAGGPRDRAAARDGRGARGARRTAIRR